MKLVCYGGTGYEAHHGANGVLSAMFHFPKCVSLWSMGSFAHCCILSFELSAYLAGRVAGALFVGYDL